jgi:hypothetical protein
MVVFVVHGNCVSAIELNHAAGACVYVAMKHPAATGVTSGYFHAVGQYIRGAM